MRPLKVTKSLQAYVNLNGMLVDGWPLYKLGIMDKEIACLLASKHNLWERLYNLWERLANLWERPSILW